MADDTLNIKITADDTGAAPAVDDVIARFEKLMGTLGGASAAHEKAGEAAEKHAEANSILGESVERVEVATNSAARVFGAMGLQTAEATERVEGLTEALHALDGAALPLIGIGAAVLALAESFNFLKEGVEEAGKAQEVFASLGQAVRNQGQEFGGEAREGVERYLDAIEHATTYSRGEALDALNKLVTAGASLADAEKMVAIATDVAAGSHRSLAEVVNALKEAEAGRGMGLIQLDEKLKTLIHSHADLSTVLAQLSEDFRGQATSASQTFEGRLAELRNELSRVGEELGEHLIKPLTFATEVIIGIAEQAEENIPKVGAFFDDLIQRAERATRVFSDLGQMANFALEAATGNIRGMTKDSKGALGASSDFGKLIGADWNPSGSGPTNPGGDPGNPIAAFFADAKKRADDLEADAQKALDSSRSQSLQHDLVMGNEGLGRGGRGGKGYEAGSYDFTPASMPSFDKDADADRQKALEDGLKSLAHNELQYEENVKLATSAQAQQMAQWALDQQISTDATAEIGKLTAAIAQETAERNKLAAALPAEESAATKATEAYNTLGAALQKESAAGIKPTKDQENALKDLKTAMDAANGSVTKTQAEISKLNGYLDANKTKLDEASKAALTYAEAMAEANRKEQEYLDKSVAAISADVIKGDQEQKARQQNFDDEIATYNKSLAAQLAYYEARYAAEVSADGVYSSEAQTTAEKILSIELDEYKQREEQHQQMVQAIEDQEQSLLDTIIGKHESFKDALHSIWQQIGGDLEKQIEGSLTAPGSPLGNLNSFLFGGATGGRAGGAASAASSGASAAGIFGSFFGSSGSSNIAASLPTNSGIFGMLFGSSAAASASGGYGGSSGSASPGGQSIFGGAGDASGLLTGPGNMASGGGLASLLKGALGGGLQGAGIGQLLSSLDGGSGLYGGIGGALGGAVGTAFGGPVGGAIGSAAGGLLGSLFGPKNQNAYGEPDIYDTQNYGSTIADLLGTAGANGQNFYESSTVKSLFNGQTALQGLEEVLAQGQASFTQNTGLSSSVYQSLLSEIGSSSTGSGQLSFGKNIGDLSVSGATGAGGTFRYTDFESLLNEYINAIQGKGGLNAIPTFSVTRSYGNPSLVTGVNSNGTFTPTASNLLGTVAGSATTTGSNGDVSSQSGASADAIVSARNPTPNVSVVINGNVVGPGGLTGVAQDIAQVLGRLSAGQIVGGGASTSSVVNLSRFTGGS